jgi:hypothetical protein
MPEYLSWTLFALL